MWKSQGNKNGCVILVLLVASESHENKTQGCVCHIQRRVLYVVLQCLHLLEVKGLSYFWKYIKKEACRYILLSWIIYSIIRKTYVFHIWRMPQSLQLYLKEFLYGRTECEVIFCPWICFFTYTSSKWKSTVKDKVKIVRVNASAA